MSLLVCMVFVFLHYSVFLFQRSMFMWLYVWFFVRISMRVLLFCKVDVSWRFRMPLTLEVLVTVVLLEKNVFLNGISSIGVLCVFVGITGKQKYWCRWNVWFYSYFHSFIFPFHMFFSCYPFLKTIYGAIRRQWCLYSYTRIGVIFIVLLIFLSIWCAVFLFRRKDLMKLLSKPWAELSTRLWW